MSSKVIGKIEPAPVGRLVRQADGSLVIELTARDLATAIAADTPPTPRPPDTP